jgi:pyrimidine deaminase RibD-like protein
MNRYEKMKIELLSGAKAASEYLAIRVHQLAFKYEIDQRHVCEKLAEFHSGKLIRLSAWDDNEGRDRPFDEWPNADAFFACRWDGNYKRVEILVRGSEFLENLAASELQSSGPQFGDDPDRMFARMAIEEARKSMPENDGRPHPWVGAVMVKDRKVLGRAHRGEMPGNHAEFVALEKNLPDVAVVGATVYTTLEPCTTRTPPKIPCVDRLIERKVARVVIGILDPDDRIRGKGQRKLSNAGIETALFPYDLAMEVEELNREFTRFCEKQSLTSRTHPANSPAGGLKPLVVPLRYGPSPPGVGKHTMGHHGLIVANHGEPAYDVSVSTPKIQIGTSELRLEGSRPVFTKADGDAFFIGTIELAPHYGTLGSGLFEEMGKFKVDEITVKLIYKDAENRWYETIGKIERDVSVSGGLSVRYVRQENHAL